MSWRSTRGFTIAELITVCAIIAVLSGLALPVARFAFRRQKEIELKERLVRITDAIDRYRALRVAPLPDNIKNPPDLNQGEYPKTLDELTKPIELNSGKKVRLLNERDLTDPITGQADWTLLSSSDDLDEHFSNGYNVFDVHSKSTALALDGKTHYNEW
ncbi:MAG TPA: prepilin-type N-terminal cleavage/methylation domain-containing protein [Thermoanaerobaculia bacterium]|jgi:general secretion pathway protein G